MIKKDKVCLWTLWTIFLALPSLLSFSAIVVLGALGINNARIDNDERYIRAYCSEEDDTDRVWLFWITGSTVAVIPFLLFGTLSVVLGGLFLGPTSNNSSNHKDSKGQTSIELKDMDGDKSKEQKKQKTRDEKPIQKMIPQAAIAVFLTMALFSIVLLLLIWCVAIAYNNARTPNKSVDLYILVDCLLGILMPILLIVAGVTGSVFLMYITKGHIDPRDIIARMLSIKLKKPEDDEDANDCWVIHETVYFQLDNHDTGVLKDVPKNEEISFSQSISTSWSTWVLAAILSVSFLLSMSYFIDRTVITSRTLQDWPESSAGDVDCFLSNSFLYVSPIEQVPTDRLNNCTVFFEQCQRNCSSDNFQSCAQECANCLTLCTNTLRSELEAVRVCNPPPMNNDGPSCPVSNAACITAASVLPQDNSSCPTAQETQGSGDVGAEIAPIIVTNNTQRLEKCAGLLDTCSMLVSMCTAPDCTELQQCNELLRECRKPPFIVCFSFLQFGSSANTLQALAESYALFMFAVSLFGAKFGIVRILLHIKETKLWGVGFVAVSALLTLIGAPALIFTGIFFRENIIKLLQFALAPIYVLLIGLLFPVAYFPAQKGTEL